MKRLLLTLLTALVFITTNAQIDTTNQFTVRDTTIQSDPRLIFLSQTILPAIAKNFNEEIARQKINGEATHLEATQVVYDEIQSAIQKYALNFIVVREVKVDTAQIITEFNELNEKINQLQNDPDIKYIEAIAEFKNIQERQAKLAEYYKKIQDKAKTTYAAWNPPTGAHDAYAVGVKVRHNNKNWENITPANVWEPGVSGWREIVE